MQFSIDYFHFTREKMKMVSIPVQLNDAPAIQWIGCVGRGYTPDKSLLKLVGFDSEAEVIIINP
jgi:hypothetical protein